MGAGNDPRAAGLRRATSVGTSSTRHVPPPSALPSEDDMARGMQTIRARMAAENAEMATRLAGLRHAATALSAAAAAGEPSPYS